MVNSVSLKKFEAFESTKTIVNMRALQERVAAMKTSDLERQEVKAPAKTNVESNERR